ncbi:CNH domain-containing protein [Mycotypha africana]|uniref:CNH domain-containing protein n=1 Tax=Mycotypha africana TaxID=64632 RepID=UPI002301F5AA|nr:CNH domain-containing protein [Mycotypha africana]KAI8979297.1 CNH domain-containing protein [Mycotypha africana]
MKEEHRRLWSHSVPEHIFQSTPTEERKRQECIYELIYTEQDFVRDLQYLHDFWVEPLLTKEIINPARREKFVKDIFHNIADIRSVNSDLAKALEIRQAEQYVVPFIGDVMLQHIRAFEPFVEYGAHQIRGKYYYELEKKRNPVFAKFVEETERRPQSRRLELNGYLTKPTTRLGRYNLLLREILKRTPEGNSDRTFIPETMKIITSYLERVNAETGKSENLFNLQQLKEKLEFKSPLDYINLELEQPQRQMLMKGRMKKKGNSSSGSTEMQVFLLDHYLVITKVKSEINSEKYRVYKKPIPLQLLTVTASAHHVRPKRQSSVLPYNKSSNIASLNSVSAKPLAPEAYSTIHKSSQFPLSFFHHGRKGSSSSITLYTGAISMQQTWLRKIMDQQEHLSKNRAVFSMKPLMTKFFRPTNRVNSTYTFRDGEKKEQLLIGAEHGVYLSYYDAVTESYGITRIIAIERVTQVELLPDCSQLLVLADKTLWAFPSDVLSSTSIPQIRKGRVISPNTSFFYIGECLGKTLLCVVKSNALSATIIRVLEPVSIDENKRSKSLFKLKQLVKSRSVGLKAYKDLYLPSEASSITLLKSKMCITSPMEIGVVDMKTFGVQALLDPEDEELAFAFNRQDVRPMTIYRIQFAEYLVCYNEFAFLVDQRGRFIRSSNRIDWEGTPDSFALCHPYILAFEPDFIEIRNIHTGELAQIIRGQNICCTSTNTQHTTVHVAMDDPENEGYQVIFQLEQNDTLEIPACIFPK